jgi:hypothetical protein
MRRSYYLSFRMQYSQSSILRIVTCTLRLLRLVQSSASVLLGNIESGFVGNRPGANEVRRFFGEEVCVLALRQIV